MDIKTSVEGTRATIALEGKLTVQTAPELESAIAGMGEEVSDFDIDLAALDYISSAGLRVLVATEKAAMRRGGGLHVLHPNDEVYEVLEMTGLSDVLSIER